MTKKNTSLVSQRDYAKHRGVTASAVNLAIKAGRLKFSIAVDGGGKNKIISLEAADKEWAANTLNRDGSTTTEEDLRQRELPMAEISSKEAKRRHQIEKLKATRLEVADEACDLKERKDDLISTGQAMADVRDDYARVRAKMMGVPAQCKQRISGMTSDDIETLDRLIREALSELTYDQPTTKEN